MRSASSGTDDLNIVSPSPVLHILVDTVGRQHVVVKTTGLRAQLLVSGVPVTGPPITLVFETRGIVNVPRQHSNFAILIQVLMNPSDQQCDDRPGRAERLEMRDSLITFDGKTCGAGHRRIAEVIYGPARVAGEWANTDGSLRQKIKRNLVRARRLIFGEYQNLLRRGQQGSLGPAS